MSDRIPDADPRAVELDAAFAEALNTPPKPAEVPPPPEVDDEAPLGRDEHGHPLAPFGFTKDGKIRRSAAGRPGKDEKPRTEPAKPKPAGTQVSAGKPKKDGKKVPEPLDYSQGLTEFSDTIWFGLTSFGLVGGKLPLVGKYIPEERIQAEAAIFKVHAPNLVGAVNLAAQHNMRAAVLAAKLAGGDITWTAQVAFMCLPFVIHTAAVIKGGESCEATVGMSVEALALKNAADLDQFMASMATAQEEAQAAAEASLNGQQPAPEPAKTGA